MSDIEVQGNRGEWPETVQWLTEPLPAPDNDEIEKRLAEADILIEHLLNDSAPPANEDEEDQ